MITALRFAPILVSLVLAISSVQAQTPPPINPVPLGSPIPRILPPPPLTVRPGAIAPPPSAPGSALLNRTVKVAGVTVDGVTAYTTAEIVPLVTGLTGPAVPLSRIEAAREVILERYRADGYVFTAVSAHIDAAGRLRFLVTEGHIVSVRLDGDIGPAGVQVLRFLKRLTEEPVIDAATLERYLLLAQDVPGVTLHAVLEPAAGQPGALDLVAQVERSPVSGLVVQGDKALAATTELQLNTSIGISVLGKSAQIPAQWYGFYDWGETWQNQPIDFATRISSAGVGVRSQVTRNLEVDAEAVARFNQFPTGAGNGVLPLSEAAFYWRAVTQF